MSQCGGKAEDCLKDSCVSDSDMDDMQREEGYSVIINYRCVAAGGTVLPPAHNVRSLTIILHLLLVT